MRHNVNGNKKRYQWHFKELPNHEYIPTYVTWTRVRASDMGADPRIRYDNFGILRYADTFFRDVYVQAFAS